MAKYFTLLLFLILSLHSFSQTLTIKGTVEDTVAKKPLQYAVAMAARLKDSTLVAFMRTDKNGFFQFNLPIDTYQVIVSHPSFGDKTFYVLGSKDNPTFDFGKFIMPPKSLTLKEVVIYAFKDPVYYKGDTLVYTADSFKTKPNATVEDLLKKLPGMRVDAQGKITSNGKAIDQVLVDGDEFFGSDPTVATRNLDAKSIESIQVYDKPKDNTAATGNDEPQKVLNLKLKDDAKKGYFGKASAATDGNQFYEDEGMVNDFHDKEKISVFGLGSNTPNNSVGWQDAEKYGLDDQMNYQADETGDTYFSTANNNTEGIPYAYKGGIYFTDKFGSSTKITANYSYNSLQIQKETETNSQYFLPDTSYKTSSQGYTYQKNEKHTVNVDVSQKIDSLTDLYIGAKFNYSPTILNSISGTQFLTSADSLSRSTNIQDYNQTFAYNSSTRINLRKRFKKKDRLLNFTYYYIINSSQSNDILQSQDYNSGFQMLDEINERRILSSTNQTHSFSADYTEPITEHFKLEFFYDFNYNAGNQNIETFNYFNGEYNQRDSLLTNNFQNFSFTNRLGGGIIYDIKKNRIYAGFRLRNVETDNINLADGAKVNEGVNSVLPYVTYIYKFSEARSLYFRYVTYSTLPSVTQLQPVPNNSNPNYIVEGNPNLLPIYRSQFSANYYSYKGVSGSYSNVNFSFTTTQHDISNSLSYDSIGRTITQPVNVNGDYTFQGGYYSTHPMFSQVLLLSPSLTEYYTNNKNFIDGQMNTTTNASTKAGLDIEIRKGILEFTLGGSYSYTEPSSTLNSASNQPYSTEIYNSELKLDLPLKLRLESNANYTVNQGQIFGYNINYLIWNASLSETLRKKENLILSFEVSDILNENVSTRRTIVDDVITDTKSNVIGRYFLVKVEYKFNSNKQKEKKDDY